MKNKKEFLLLWKWAVKLFRRRWFRYKAIDRFLTEGKVECKKGEQYRYTMRKSFAVTEDNEVTEYWIELEFYVMEPYIDIDLLTEMKGTEEKES